MFSDSIEVLKNQYTDKYVAVDESRPELARFRGAVGQVKTVNMSGRALVQFLDYHLNTGWYDIDPSFLRVVEPPPKDVAAKPEAKRAQDKPAGKAAPTAGDKQIADAGATKKLSPLEMARQQGGGAKGGAAATKPAGDKKGTSDILAAARGGSAPEAKAASAEKLAAAPKAAAPTGKSSTADILAAARGGKTAEPTASAPAAPAPAKAAPPAAAPEEAATPAAPATAPAGNGVVKVDRKSMNVEQMIAYCRKADAK